MKTLLKVGTLVAISTSTASAQFIAPAGVFSATVPAGVTFGGAGIPGPVMTARVVTRNGPLLVIGASQRGDNAALGNDGAGTYTGAAGNDASTSPAAVPGYATWNFNFYVGGPTASQYNYRLFYDFNPLAGSLQTQPTYGVINIFGSSITGGAIENSFNLGMGFLSAGVPNLVIPPPTAFSPLLDGTYSFALVAYEALPDRSNPFGAELARAAIDVNMSAVPEPSTYALMATGLIGTGLAARRRRKTATSAS